MTKRIEYYYGQILNDKGTKFICDVESQGKRRLGKFLCGECHTNTFVAQIENVKAGKKFRCELCQEKHGYVRDSITGKPLIDNLVGQKFGHLTVIKYLGPDKKSTHHSLWLCQCDCGRFSEVRGNNLKTGHTQSCGVCHTSLGEDKIESILKEKYIKYFTQYSFTDCKNKKPLRFDFYLPDYNCCIEYDGKQHYEIKGTFYEGHEQEYYDQKERDNIKTKYCMNNNISLYRIPYTDYNILEIKINDILKEVQHDC